MRGILFPLCLTLVASPTWAAEGSTLPWQSGDHWEYTYAASGGRVGTLNRTLLEMRDGIWIASVHFQFSSIVNGTSIQYSSESRTEYSADGATLRVQDQIEARNGTQSSNLTFYTSFDPARDELGLGRRLGETWSQQIRVTEEFRDAEGRPRVNERNETVWARKESAPALELHGHRFDVYLLRLDDESADTDGTHSLLHISPERGAFALRIDNEAGKDVARTELVSFAAAPRPSPSEPRGTAGPDLFALMGALVLAAAAARFRPATLPDFRPKN